MSDVISIDRTHPLDEPAPTPEPQPTQPTQPTQPIVSAQERASMIWIRFRDLISQSWFRVPDKTGMAEENFTMEQRRDRAIAIAVGDVDALIAAIEEGDRTQ